MGDTFALTASLDRIQPKRELIVGAGYVGLEMAEGLTMRGIEVTQVEMLPEVLPTVEVELGALVHDELVKHGVEVHTNATVTRITKTDTRLHVDGNTTEGEALAWDVELVLVVVGVRPDTVQAGAQTGPRGAALFHEMTVSADDRARPVLRPAVGLALGRRPDGHPGLVKEHLLDAERATLKKDT